MEDKTDDKPGAKRSGGGAAILVALVVGFAFLPLVYTLSVGPVILMVDRNWIGQEWMPALEATYSPLEWTAENVPIAGPAIMAYAEWWQNPAPRPIYEAPPPALVNPPPAPSTPQPGSNAPHGDAPDAAGSDAAN